MASTRTAAGLGLAAATLAGLAACGAERAPPLAPIQLDASRVAVAGLSSGAYMATQVHVALNARVHGAALVAGGPYGCAQGALNTALGPCITVTPSAPDVAALAAQANARVAAGSIDPLSAFAGDRVLVLHGTKDATVSPALAPA
ncbi:MAG: PHB depolymerase family esterase, partial [Silanimonas sp.]